MSSLAFVVLWLLLSALALLGWGVPIVWVGALAIPVAGAGFAWGHRGALGLGLASAAVALTLPFKGEPIWVVAGPWSCFAAVPWLILRKEREFRGKGSALARQTEELNRQASLLQAREAELKARISGIDRAIQEMGELYQLSKRFLATLEAPEGLRIVEEALERWMPFAAEGERAAVVGRVQALLERGDISVERLMEAVPLAGADSSARERWGIASGQVALGLKRIALYRSVQESATQDGLTGLLVRRVFLERLETEVQRALRRGTWLAFLMVDLDHFKQINDTYGHLVGDVVLREVARLIRGSVRETDWVGRYGGEEFSVALPEADLSLGVQIAERIRRTVEATPIAAYDERIRITVSIGGALCPAQGASAESLIERADQAMYQAKAEGRNRVVVRRCEP